MNNLSTVFTNITTYGVTLAGIVVNFDNIKSFILFVLGASLLILQIIKHVKDLKKDK